MKVDIFPFFLFLLSCLVGDEKDQLLLQGNNNQMYIYKKRLLSFYPLLIFDTIHNIIHYAHMRKCQKSQAH